MLIPVLIFAGTLPLLDMEKLVADLRCFGKTFGAKFSFDKFVFTDKELLFSGSEFSFSIDEVLFPADETSFSAVEVLFCVGSVAFSVGNIVQGEAGLDERVRCRTPADVTLLAKETFPEDVPIGDIFGGESKTEEFC